MKPPRLAASLLAVMVLAPACASTQKGPSVPARTTLAQTPRTEAAPSAPAATDLAEPVATATPGDLATTPPGPTECERQVRAAHGFYLTQLALHHGVGGTLYLSFVGAAQGAFYGAISGGGSGAGQGAWIGAAAGAGVGLVLGSLEGWSRTRDARAAYQGALASCRAAALAPAPVPAPPPPPSPPPHPARAVVVD
jgi:hypothetical protein